MINHFQSTCHSWLESSSQLIHPQRNTGKNCQLLISWRRAGIRISFLYFLSYFRWEPNEPLQIAFWSVSGICLILIVVLVACCLLWRTAKGQRDRVYQDYGPGNRPLGVGPISKSIRKQERFLSPTFEKTPHGFRKERPMMNNLCLCSVIN